MIARILLFAFGATFLICSESFSHEHHHHPASTEDMDRARPEPLSGESIFQLDSTWVESNGSKVRLSVLRKKPTVLAMIYTSCQGACPILTSDMQRIEKLLTSETREKTQFVLVSLDSARDTPDMLSRFAKNHGLDPKRWRLFTGPEEAVRQLAAVLGVKYKREAQGDFSHSNVITILDSEGLIRHQQIGLGSDPGASVQALLEPIH